MRIGMRKLLISIWPALLLIGSGAIAADFTPMHIGDKFVFTAHNSVGGTWELKYSISAAVVSRASSFTFKSYYMLDELAAERWYTPIIQRSTPDALYRYVGFGREYMLFRNAPVGTKWTYTDEQGRTMEGEILATNETVTVPAGTFYGCLKQRTHCPSDPGNTDWFWWVKPGAGCVKFVIYDYTIVPVYPPWVYELKSATRTRPPW